jgi:PAS domain S-box-containing protein
MAAIRAAYCRFCNWRIPMECALFERLDALIRLTGSGRPGTGEERMTISEPSLSPSPLGTSGGMRIINRVWSHLPEGRPLPDETWRQRHRGIIILLALHALGIVCFGLLVGAGLIHSLLEGGAVALAALAASVPMFNRRTRAAVACLGLITASGVLVHLAGGYIEFHFHFFVMVIVISLYQDWVPFLLTIGYVVVHHGTFGVLYPTSVYNHPDAWAHPWKWAAIHGVFVLGASVASLINWRLTEVVRAQSDLLLLSAGDGIYGIDRAGKTTFVNPTGAALLGWQAEDLVGRSVDALLWLTPSDGTATDVKVAIAQALREGVAQPRNMTIFVRKDGTTFPAEYVCRPIRERNRISGVVITFQDISVRKQAEEDKLAYVEERKRAQEQIIQLQQAQLANLSTPLIPLVEQVVLMPLIGTIDSQRGEQVIAQLLQGIQAHRARLAILDVTGVPVMDAPVANALLRAAQAVRLLGTQLVVTGIRPEVAQTLVSLGVDLQGIVAESTLQAGVRYALQQQQGAGDQLGGDAGKVGRLGAWGVAYSAPPDRLAKL